MEMMQFFESTIMSDSTLHAAHLISVPRRTFLAYDKRVDSNKIIRGLGLKTLAPVTTSKLASFLSILLSDSVEEQVLVQSLTISGLEKIEMNENDVYFAEMLAFERMVLFENSPIEFESLAKLVTTASGAAIGTYAGFVLAGPTPLLLVAVPAGMILFGAAKGVADALEQGLRERLLKFLRGREVKARRDTKGKIYQGKISKAKTSRKSG
jgi:hypothetical protein